MSFNLQTKSTTISSFTRRYPQAGSLWSGELYDRAFNWALDKAEIRLSSVDISVTAGTREYDLAAGVLRVESAEYWTSAESYSKLRATSREELDAGQSGWRTAEGEPTTYYVDSVASTGNLAKNVIGFREKPTVTTSSGYPKVTLRCQFVDSLSGSDSLPPILRDDTAILDKMYALYAKEKDPKNFALYHSIAEQSARDLVNRVKELGDESPTVLISGAAFSPRRRR